jgi:hypothetical protein
VILCTKVTCVHRKLRLDAREHNQTRISVLIADEKMKEYLN